MLKELAIAAVFTASSLGLQHILIKTSRDADAPIVAIEKAQASHRFGWQMPPAQLQAIMSGNTQTISADRAAMARAEKQATQ